MKKEFELETLQRDYFQRLLSDQSVEDKMPFFTYAQKVFQLVNRKVRNKRRSK